MRQSPGRRLLPLAMLVTAGCSIQEWEAVHACQEAVRNQLLAPSTADFPATWDAVIEASASGYIVRSTVESMNAMAVPIRQEFLCRVKNSFVVEAVLNLDIASRGTCDLNKTMEREGMPEDVRLEILAEDDLDLRECRLYERASATE